jgi:hypothetical protein
MCYAGIHFAVREFILLFRNAISSTANVFAVQQRDFPHSIVLRARHSPPDMKVLQNAETAPTDAS